QKGGAAEQSGQKWHGVSGSWGIGRRSVDRTRQGFLFPNRTGKRRNGAGRRSAAAPGGANHARACRWTRPQRHGFSVFARNNRQPRRLTRIPVAATTPFRPLNGPPLSG